VPLLPDLTPLQGSADYRRLYAGFTLAGIGSQLATVAIGLQVFELTRSTAAVGVVGLCALVPLVVMGLYGGSLVDHHDRRTVALLAQGLSWLTSLACVIQAWLGNERVWVLYLLVALWNGTYAVTSPARSSIYPRILPREQLPSANALSVIAMNVSMTVGPLIAGVLIQWRGYGVTYLVDAVITTAALWGLWRLGPVPPEVDPEADPELASRAGLRSVIDGLAFLGTRPVLRMTFVVDIVAMVLAQPRVLLPAAGAVILGGGAATVGALYSAVAVGGILTMLGSGRLTGLRHQGVAILWSVAGWGLGIAGLGAALLAAGGPLTTRQAFWAAMAAMAVAGGCDAVSAMFRSTILQSAAPDRMRGRLQGVFVVVVAGGPRLGELLCGALAALVGEGSTAVLGGLACIGVMGALAVTERSFVRYDARQPVS